MLLAGPFAGRLLGDMGAEVIKVEPPASPTRCASGAMPATTSGSLWWPVQSRNKKCITLNLREQQGQELLLELVRVSDVVSENFRPGTLERWNLGYERLSEVNPGIVLARVSGYGQTGPYADRAGFASVAEAMGGLRYINGFPGEAPPRTGISLGDSLAAMFATQGILAALYQRDVLGDGRGQVVDVSLLESCFALLESAVPEYDRLGVIREPAGTGTQGRRALEHLQVAGRQVGRDRREPGQRLPPPVRGDGHAGARHRRAFLDPPRTRREPGGDRGDHLRLVGTPRRRSRSTAS